MRRKGGNGKYSFILRKNFNATRQKLNEFLSQCARGFVIAHSQRRIVKAPTHYHAVIVLSQAMDNIVTKSRKNNVKFLIFGILHASLGAPFFHFFFFYFFFYREKNPNATIAWIQFSIKFPPEFSIIQFFFLKIITSNFLKFSSKS